MKVKNNLRKRENKTHKIMYNISVILMIMFTVALIVTVEFLNPLLSVRVASGINNIHFHQLDHIYHADSVMLTST